MKLKLIPKECEAVRWTGNNFKEVKDFCKESCTITYESCEIDDYWLVKVYDMFKDNMVVVPDGDYIVKIGHGFIVVNDVDLHNWFIWATEFKPIENDCILENENEINKKVSEELSKELTDKITSQIVLNNSIEANMNNRKKVVALILKFLDSNLNEYDFSKKYGLNSDFEKINGWGNGLTLKNGIVCTVHRTNPMEFDDGGKELINLNLKELKHILKSLKNFNEKYGKITTIKK